MKYFIKTFGCQMNESDSERIATFLEKRGYKKSADMEIADLIVVNACSVRQTAIDRIFGLKPKILKLKFQNPNFKSILTGCILKSDKPKFKKFFDAILNIKEFFTFPILHDRDKKVMNYLRINPKYKKKDSAFVPIMTGCDNFCSYCVVPYTRGREISRPAQEIINEVKSLVKRGYSELTLLGQNVNSYKSKFKNQNSKLVDFPTLLKLICNIPGNFTVKFLTSHPKDMSDELIETITECRKISKEIHLPIQSGDNKILKKMNRGYTIGKYKNLIKKIRAKIPQVEITTDVIVGFPGETKKQFENTVKAFEEIKFAKAYVNKYSTRTGTLAAKLKNNVSLTEKKRRWKILNDLVNLSRKPKLVVVLGPTASGKSDLAIKIAKKFNGEVISADSRQIYKQMDIGTGKISKKKMQGIPHYCLDIANPRKQITVAEYRKKALETIDNIYKKGGIPIICGGTGFYIQAMVEGLDIPKIKPDWKLRKELEKKTTEELFKQLKKLDPNRAQNIDTKNPRRLIRALEIIKKTGKPVPPLQFSAQGGPAPCWDVLYIGIKKPLPELKKLINRRIDKMIKSGLEKEVKRLIKRHGKTIVLRNTIGYKEWFKNPPQSRRAGGQIKNNTYQYAKRQLIWFRKYPGNKKIHWVKNYLQADKLIEKFLSC